MATLRPCQQGAGCPYGKNIIAPYSYKEYTIATVCAGLLQCRGNDIGAVVDLPNTLTAEMRRQRYYATLAVERASQREVELLQSGVISLGAFLDGRLVALAHLMVYEREVSVELGFMTDPAHGGKGLALELARKLMEHAGLLGYKMALIHTQPDNRPMRRVMSKLGTPRLVKDEAEDWVCELKTTL